MKLPSMFISVALLTPGVSIHAMEQSVTPIDLKTQLQVAVIACDAQQFKDTWSQYQITTQEQELVTTRTALTQLANQLHAQKTQERTVKLNDKWSRRIAGMSAAPPALMFALGGSFIVYAIGEDLINHRIPILSHIYRSNFEMAQNEVAGYSIISAFSAYCARLALKDINYARFADTQQLTKDISALDAILSCLNPQESDRTDTQTEEIE